MIGRGCITTVFLALLVLFTFCETSDFSQSGNGYTKTKILEKNNHFFPIYAYDEYATSSSPELTRWNLLTTKKANLDAIVAELDQRILNIIGGITKRLFHETCYFQPFSSISQIFYRWLPERERRHHCQKKSQIFEPGPTG